MKKFTAIVVLGLSAFATGVQADQTAWGVSGRATDHRPVVRATQPSARGYALTGQKVQAKAARGEHQWDGSRTLVRTN